MGLGVAKAAASRQRQSRCRDVPLLSGSPAPAPCRAWPGCRDRSPCRLPAWACRARSRPSVIGSIHRAGPCAEILLTATARGTPLRARARRCAAMTWQPDRASVCLVPNFELSQPRRRFAAQTQLGSDSSGGECLGHRHRHRPARLAHHPLRAGQARHRSSHRSVQDRHGAASCSVVPGQVERPYRLGSAAP